MPNQRRTLAQARIGDRVERLWKNELWYAATITDERQSGRGARQVLVHDIGTKSKLLDEWLSVASPRLNWPRTDDERYLDSLSSATGHVDGATWVVDKLLGERTSNSGKQYLVRWEGWSEADDSWEPAESISAPALKEFADKLAKDEAEARRLRAEYARDPLMTFATLFCAACTEPPTMSHAALWR